MVKGYNETFDDWNTCSSYGDVILDYSCPGGRGR